MIIIDDDGNEVEVFTAEELAQKAEEKVQEAISEKQKELEELQATLADKEEHYKTKIDEFTKGKKGAVEIEKTALEKIELAQKEIELMKTQKNESLIRMALGQITGGDEELSQKVRDALSFVNVAIESDEDIFKQVQLAAKIADVEPVSFGGSNVPSFSVGNTGFAPTSQQVSEKESEDNYNDFKNVFGLELPNDNK